MAKSIKARFPGIQAAYKRNGFNGVWKLVKGHGLKRWIKARNWARARAKQAKDPKAYRHAQEEYQKHVLALKKHQREQQAQQHQNQGDIITVDGVPVPGWLGRGLLQARAEGVWKGTLLSGVRTVQHSIDICEAQCHAPSCPGTCAGATTNHTCPPSHTCVPYEGAADVTDPAGFEAWCRANNFPAYGAGYALPNDVNHFSHTGH